MLPTHIEQLKGKVMKSFHDFLIARGSQVLLPTNEYEVMRFTGPEGCLCIIYRNKSGFLRWSEHSSAAYGAFKAGTEWRATAKIIRTKGGKKKFAIKQNIASRDGVKCFYCQGDYSLEDLTIEHFVPVSAGGPDHISNMALSCSSCNHDAGHMCVSDKLNLAMERRHSKNG